MPSTINFTQKLKKLKSPERLAEIAEKAKSNLLRTLEEEGQWLEEVADLTATDLHNFVAEAKKRLDETIEKSRSPLRVSLIGPFSSGKTVTLCALLGQPNLLPRAAQPTSGNVVEVQIVPPGTSDKLNVMDCTLFSPLELENMLRDYYHFLRSKRLDLKALPETNGFLREQVNRLCQDVKEQLSEKRREFKKSATSRVSFEVLTNLAHLYFILVTIKHYLDSYPGITNPESLILSIPYHTTEKRAQDRLIAVTMLDMQWGIEELEPERLAEKVDKFWQHLPANLADLKKSCEKGTVSTEALRALLPLYKRILLTQEMKLSEAEWKGIQRVSFLDFPGVGSDNRRDTYLCLKELPQAHVNMLFFLANRPAAKEAQQLLEIIAEAKQHLTQLSDRIIPVVNFFDGYDRLPEVVSMEDARMDTPEKEQQALQRVQNFFSTEKVSGVEEGFDVFDKSILGGLFPDSKEWDYYLLSPIVSMNSQSLTDKEKKYVEVYDHQKERYGQLLRDVEIAEKLLKQDRAAYGEPLKKYQRLLFALESYHEDGGIKRLREDLIKLLKDNGFRLIIEDAAPTLQAVLEQAEADIIDKLADVDVNEREAEECLGDKKTRETVVALWEQMNKLTQAWLPRSDLVALQHQDPLTKERREIKYISPLKLCEAKVLEEVLADNFWQEWVNRWLVPPADAQPTPLSELKAKYHELEQRLTQWSRTAIEQTISQTLDKLDQHPLPLDTGDLVSFAELRNTLFSDYVNKANEVVTTEEKQILTELFSLTSLKEELRHALEDLKDKQESSSPPKEENTKVPFNENLQFSWSPVELMKIQRQVILTLQRRVASYFAFYISSFFQEFQRLLDQRTHQARQSISYHRQEFEQPGGLFDKLARIPQAVELVQKDSLTRRERRQKAKEAVAKIRDAWEELLKQL